MNVHSGRVLGSCTDRRTPGAGELATTAELVVSLLGPYFEPNT